MENASKALIIAGAILISILLIAVAMYIYNAAKQPLLSAAEQMSSQDVQSYNSNFTPFLGDTVKGSTVRALIDTAINVNNSHAGETGVFTQLAMPSGVAPASKTLPNGETGTNYFGSAGATGNTTGYVSTVAQNLQDVKSQINTSKRYTVKATYGDTGLITKIDITGPNT